MNNFLSLKNKQFLINLLKGSKIDTNDTEVGAIITKEFNNIVNENNRELGILGLNKLFIKRVIEKNKKDDYNGDFYRNRKQRALNNDANLKNKLEGHMKDINSFSKKKPEEIDFKDNNWDKEDLTSMEEKITKTIENRKKDLGQITQSYTKVAKNEEFQDNSFWLKNQTFKKRKKEKIQITDIDINLKDKIVVKKVSFSTDNVHERLTKLENKVEQLNRLIKDVLSEKIMKKTI